MSEYQYYEFQAIDRPLSEKAQEEMEGISSRVRLSPHRAIFTYSYSDLPGSAKKLLGKHFDAMLYLANWGTRRLMFRLPRSIVDTERLDAYCYPDIVTTSVTSNYIILDISFDDEEGGFWVEGEGWLTSLVSIRQDLIRGDFRALYLTWLKAIKVEEHEYKDEDDFEDDEYDDDSEDRENEVEPPVPPNLAKLSTSLKKFVEFFEIDEDLIAVASQASVDEKDATELDVETLVGKLSEKEREGFLIRVAKGEPNMDIQLMNRLRELSTEKPSTTSAAPRRKASELLAAAKERVRRRKEEAKRKAAKARIRRLNELAPKAEKLWEQVFALIAQKQTKAYEEAIKILIDLRDVADHVGEFEDFEARINQIHEDYSRLSGLIGRLNSAGLKKQG